MAIGLHASDGPKIHQLCGGDRRLFMRLGALLQSRLSVSEAVVTEAMEQDWLRQLVMHRQLKDVAPKDFRPFADGFGDPAEELMLINDPGEAGWRILAWADELDNPLLQMDTDLENQRNLQGLRAVLPQATMETRFAIDALLAADSDEERAAALEKLRYHLPPPAVLMELMPLVLTDSSAEVRDRAHHLLVASGANAAVVDLIKALQEEDEKSIATVRDGLRGLSTDQIQLAMGGILAHFGQGLMNQELLRICQDHAALLLRHPQFDRFVELVLGSSQGLSVLPLFRALQDLEGDRVNAEVQRLLDHGAESDARIIAILVGPGAPVPEDQLARAVSLLLAPGHVPRDRMGLAAAMARCSNPTQVVAAIIDRREDLVRCVDSAALWLLATFARAGIITPAQADLLLQSLIAICREGVGTQILAMLEQQLPRLLPASDELKRELVEPLGEAAGRSRDQRFLDVIRHNFSGLGPAAASALWRIINEHPRQAARRVAIDALPDIYADGKADAITNAVDRALALVPDDPAREPLLCELLCLAGRLAVLPVMTDDAPARRVDERAATVTSQAIPCWGHLAASPHLTVQRRSEIIDLLLRLIAHKVEEECPEERYDQAEDATTFVLDAALSRHTEMAPQVLVALKRIARAPSLPVPLLKHIVARLGELFANVAGWKTVWAPGNVIDLAQTLKAIAITDACPPPLRTEVAKQLRPHINTPLITVYLAEVLRRAEQPFLAGQCCADFITLLAGERMADEDQRLIGDALAAFLAIPDLGEHHERHQRRLVANLGEIRYLIQAKTRSMLKDLLPGLAPALQERLDWLG